MRGYAELVIDSAAIAGGMADAESVQALVSEVPGMADYVEMGKQGLEDTSVTIQQLVDDVLSGYIWRRRLWIAAFTSAVVIAGFFIPSRRRSSHKASLSADMYGGGGYSSSSSSSSSLNF